MGSERISTHALTEGDCFRESFSFRIHISTHALTEGDFLRGCALIRRAISTHALTEGDSAGQCDLHLQQGISTHALTEGDRTRSSPFSMLSEFQLTPSRRATVSTSFPHHQIIFQLTPSRRATANLDKFFF